MGTAMRGYKLRLLSCGLLATLFAWLVTWGGHSLNGQPAAAGGLQPVKKGDKDKEKKEDRSEIDDNLPFAPPYERSAKQQLKAARDYLEFKEPPYNQICEFLQRILDAKSDSFFDVKYKVGNETRVNRISVKTEANRIIAEFKPEGLQFYQQAYGATAAGLLEDAIKANCDVPLLADILSDMVWQATFPEAEVGLEREVIGEEITMYKESPADHIGDMISAAL